MKLGWNAVLIIGALFLYASLGLAQDPSPEGARCSALGYSDWSGIPDAPTQITGAKTVPGTADLPAYCRVTGYVSPNVGFELRLPSAQWNGKFLGVGCGGWCGATLEAQAFWPQRAVACDDALRRGYACIANDSGHRSTIGDLKWAYNNLGAIVDYAYRATHVATIAGKAIARQFYDKVPQHSYFQGCSGGGREGLIEAQRFPDDYDGIVAGAPALDVEGGMTRLLWTALSVRGTGDKPLLGPEQLMLVHQSVVNQCDMNDGLKDGFIGDPRSCRFDVSSLACKKGDDSAQCLNDGQIAAVKRIYGGPINSKGERVYRTGTLVGTEMEWSWFDTNAASELFRYMGFWPSPGPAWKATDFDFDRDPQRLGLLETLFDATNPDLHRFKAGGGKLLAYHGWSDHLQDGTNTISYYETVERTMGGSESTRDFFRLFMLPGVGHCSGEGPDVVDYLSAVEAWVEKSTAPDVLIAAQAKPGTDTSHLPLAASAVVLTRPVYPYPTRTRYKGKGPSSDASSFAPAK